MNAKRMLMHWLLLAFVLLALVLVMLWPVSVPGHFQAGLNAFGRGEYETACREWLPLAEQRDADAGTTRAKVNDDDRSRRPQLS